ncbi:hypothetical protein [Legionella spiritensis]|uniref:Ankyrin repeats (3 copies) n=1 Tax=Legionella spiritensis TaxID=452 RepID=A0A0W0Z256_LEGSP|nr:hypothetical protein [Legionella spiritensis]KTD63229.1 Ankyrin repeats (3 copies) [Legionella spiritensis]SNV31580.1 Ankyrin repeats (3 copies) [Legionella spiritensis]
MSHNTNDHHYSDFFLRHIPSDLYKKLTEDQKKRLYPKLYLAVLQIPPGIVIEEEWQLRCLLGDMDINAINKKDGRGANPAHYAAWSGNPDALDWVDSNCKGLLEEIDYFGRNICHYAAWSSNPDAMAWFNKNYKELLGENDFFQNCISHYAAWSGNPRAMDWVKSNYNELLERKDLFNRNIGHYAAWSSNPDALEWVKDNCPDLLNEVDDDGEKNIAHYAAFSASVESLEWVKRNYPALIKKKDTRFRSIAHYAAKSGKSAPLDWVKIQYPNLLNQTDKLGCNIAILALVSGVPEQFSYAMRLIDSPQQLILPIDGELVFNMLVEAMKTNFSLTEVTLPENASELLRKDVQDYCERNQSLAKICQEFKILLQGHFQNNNNPHLIKDILYHIFQFRTSSYEIDEPIVKKVFEDMYKKLKHENRYWMTQREITDLVKSRLGELQRPYTFFKSINKTDEAETNLLESFLNEVCFYKYNSKEQFQKAIEVFFEKHKDQLLPDSNSMRLFEKIIGKAAGIGLNVMGAINEHYVQVTPGG